MSTYSYFDAGQLLMNAAADAPDYRRIIGRKGADADRVHDGLTRTAAGNTRLPEDPWRAHNPMQQHGKEIARVVRSREDGSMNASEADAGTVTVFFADGTHTYVHQGDLFCVEFGVGA
jgi:hypothetical protein